MFSGYVDQNLNLIANMELARRDMYLQKIATKNDKKEDSSPGPIDTGDALLQELCSNEDHSNAEIETNYYGHLKKIFSSSPKWKKGTPGKTSGRYPVSIGGLGKNQKNIMIGLFWNVRGIGQDIKKRFIRKMIIEKKLDFIGL